MKRIGGRYVVESLIASGGMGTLHRGRDEQTGDAVAIKILKPSHGDDPIVSERFLREGLTLARLAHPNIVRVRDAGQDGADLYMVLELLTGETLEAVIAREGAMTAAHALPIVDRILEALETCHAQDIVHRDVKPANVMIGDGSVKLIDFGLAKIGNKTFDKLTETGTVQGTPHYMAPEQCRGEEVGAAADIYSVGVLCYEMLAGRTPFAGNDAATFMAQHLFVDAPPLANVAPGIAAAVASALAKRPEDRPTARALRESLEAGAGGTDPTTRGQAAATHRVEQLAKPREERAIGSAAAHVRPTEGAAIVWLPPGDRSGAILGCLGTAGIACTHASTDVVPDGSAVVVTSGLDRVRRARAKDRRMPIVVVDIGGPDETAEAIRAGADDMLLRGAPEADLVAKVRRLAKKVRR